MESRSGERWDPLMWPGHSGPRVPEIGHCPHADRTTDRGHRLNFSTGFFFFPFSFCFTLVRTDAPGVQGASADRHSEYLPPRQPAASAPQASPQRSSPSMGRRKIRRFVNTIFLGGWHSRRTLLVALTPKMRSSLRPANVQLGWEWHNTCGGRFLGVSIHPASGAVEHSNPRFRPHGRFFDASRSEMEGRGFAQDGERSSPKLVFVP